MDKIKAFFQNKITRTVLWILGGLVVVGLIIGGATLESINSGAALVVGVIDAVVMLGLFITEQVKK